MLFSTITKGPLFYIDFMALNALCVFKHPYIHSDKLIFFTHSYPCSHLNIVEWIFIPFDNNTAEIEGGGGSQKIVGKDLMNISPY